ncbi:hypothetical protein FRC10_000726 [Ceratobasidium sp. 414]|nr:hypothetical protein FRC10_000726 [Ceratobasidium sp. 414]
MSAHSKLIDDGATLIETVTRPTVDGKPGGSPLDDVMIHDGFYRIAQYDGNGTEFDALSDNSTQDSLTMESIPRLTTGAEWVFTRQWGPIKNGFTIVPKAGPDIEVKLGGTVDTAGFGMLITSRLSHFPVWQVRCDESRTYRIIEPFRGFYDQGVWRTSASDWKLMGIQGASWDPINPLELYQLVPLGVPKPGNVTA